MTEPSLHTTELQPLLEGWQRGEVEARNELLSRVRGRLERLVRKMLDDYSRVRRFEQTDDVLQRSLLRLSAALEEVRPASTREFFRLAALQVRRVLLDLVKHLYGPEGLAANQRSHDPDRPPERADDTHDPARLAEWCEVHQQIDRLPEEEREVVDLLYYQELSQADAATVLNVSVRTVQRRWQSALLSLHSLLHVDTIDP